MEIAERTPCAHDDASRPARRPNYFQGKLLGVDDFAQEQEYHRSKRRLHNRLLHGWGVVAGLEVSAGQGDTELLISPGLAIDACGNEILVPEHMVVDASAWPSTGSGNRDVYLAIRYAEAPTAPEPSPDGGERFGRIEEGFDVALLSGLPAPYDPMPSPDFSDMVGCAEATWARPFPPPAEDPWIILADVMLGGGGRVAGIDQRPHRRFVAAFGDFWFICPRTAPAPGARASR